MTDTGIRSPEGTPTSRELGYEVRDTNLRVVIVFGIALFAITAACYVATIGVFTFFAWRADRGQPVLTPATTLRKQDLPADPRLQTSPPSELVEFRARSARELESYGWVDSSAGIVHVPIDRAIDLVAKEGLGAAAR